MDPPVLLVIQFCGRTIKSIRRRTDRIMMWERVRPCGVDKGEAGPEVTLEQVAPEPSILNRPHWNARPVAVAAQMASQPVAAELCRTGVLCRRRVKGGLEGRH